MIVFLCVLIMILITLIIILFSYIEINIQDITIDSSKKAANILKTLIQEKNTINRLDILNYVSFNIKLKIKLFNKIPIISIKRNNYQIKELIIKQYTKEMKKTKKQIAKDKKKAKNIINNIKAKIIFVESTFDMALGTEDAAFTAITSSIINIIISLTLPYIVNVENAKNFNYNVKPIYLNKNVFFLQFSGIIALKIIHIINVICKDKEERIK